MKQHVKCFFVPIATLSRAWPCIPTRECLWKKAIGNEGTDNGGDGE